MHWLFACMQPSLRSYSFYIQHPTLHPTLAPLLSHQSYFTITSTSPPTVPFPQPLSERQSTLLPTLKLPKKNTKKNISLIGHRTSQRYFSQEWKLCSSWPRPNTHQIRPLREKRKQEEKHTGPAQPFESQSDLSAFLVTASN